MQIVALVRDVQVNRNNAEKPFAVITLETEQPLQIVEIRLFKNQIDAGIADKLIPMKGKMVFFPIEPQIYNGRLQFQFPFDGVVKPAFPSSQPKAVNS